MEKVLIIEDDEALCNRLKIVIAKEGFEVFTAYDGDEGINIFRSVHVDIVISDYSLPQKTGLEVMRIVLSEHPETGFIMVTGHGSQDIAIEAINEGALDYIKKPIDIDQLFIALGRYMERKQLKIKNTPIPSLLVLEDDEITKNRFVKELKKENYFVLEGSNGYEGLKIVEQNKIDVIITDLNMPEMGGLDFIKEVRKITYDQEIIIVTGYGEEDETIEALRYGAYAYLKKPFNIEELFITVEKALEKLTLRRNLLFRNRDYEIMQEIVGAFSKDKKIIIDLRNEASMVDAINFAQQVIDVALLNVVIFDKNYNIVFQNKSCADCVGDKATMIDDAWLSGLGLMNYSFDRFYKSVTKVFDADKTILEYEKVNQFSHVLLTRLTALTDSGINTWCVAFIRGERKI